MCLGVDRVATGDRCGVKDRLYPRDRLVTPAFAAVTLASLVFFVYIGVLVAVVPRFVENELGAGELGVGLTLAVFAGAAIAIRPAIGWAGDRFGRRRLMMAGAVLAAVAGGLCGLAPSLPVLLVLRALTGVGEAALFVGAATLIADLSPADRRAEGASYFSVAVFGGIGVGPVFGEWVLADDRYVLTFAVAGALALVAAVLVLAVPRRVDRFAPPGPRARPALVHRAAIWPGLVLCSGIAGFSVFGAFMPEHARSVGLSGAGGLLLVYSLVCLVLRIAGARLPERLGAGPSVTIALTLLATALLVLSAVPHAWGLWVAAAVSGVGMAFMYPSLMAVVVNAVDDAERSSAVSSFTMFFEVGTIIGGLVLGGLGELFGKRIGFLGGAILCALGLVALWGRVVGRSPVSAPAPMTVAVVAGD